MTLSWHGSHSKTTDYHVGGLKSGSEGILLLIKIRKVLDLNFGCCQEIIGLIWDSDKSRGIWWKFNFTGMWKTFFSNFATNVNQQIKGRFLIKQTCENSQMNDSVLPIAEEAAILPVAECGTLWVQYMFNWRTKGGEIVLEEEWRTCRRKVFGAGSHNEGASIHAPFELNLKWIHRPFGRIYWTRNDCGLVINRCHGRRNTHVKDV